MAPNDDIIIKSYHSFDTNYGITDKKQNDCSKSGQTSDKLDSNDEKLVFSRKQVIIILLLCYGYLFTGCCDSVLAPFFPIEAKNKGLSETWIGIIIGQYQFSMIFGSIISGKMLSTLTPKFMLTTALTVVGIGSTCWGFLLWSPNGTPFIILGLTLRTIEGLGASVFFTSCWTLICIEFPKNIPKLLAMTEMCFGAGIIFGPSMGGLLNQLGQNYFGDGFPLPFFVMGGLIFIGALLIHLALPKSKSKPNVEETSISSILREFKVFFCLLITFNCYLIFGFNEATLELHLETIQELSPSATGGIFALSGTVYVLSNLVWAHFAEKMDNCYPLCLIACICSLSAFLISGPAPFIPIQANLWLVIVAQVFIGLGMGGQSICSFIQGLRETLKSGFEDNVSTYAAVSGIFYSGLALGSTVGSGLGGYLMGHLGYRWTTLPIIGLNLFLSLAIILLNIAPNIKKLCAK